MGHGRQELLQQERCPAYGIGSDYMSGTPIRQDYLETVIKWINDGDIEGYMAKHQHEPNANELWLYFQTVIAWVKATFPNVPQGDEGRPLGRALQRVQGRANWTPRSLRNGSRADGGRRRHQEAGHLLLSCSTGRRSTSTSGRSPEPEARGLRAAGRASARSAASHFDLRRWKPTTSRRGTRAARRKLRNCKMLCKEDNRRKGGV